ncbi:unnamed protein product [Meganyctiphanes norvegica]|uniref:Uncharacterized protein n=1 Tax=Meganyctiphanes norvegica TaxID=48144 RepID=A0AAV2RGE6_MEGNR
MTSYQNGASGYQSTIGYGSINSHRRSSFNGYRTKRYYDRYPDLEKVELHSMASAAQARQILARGPQIQHKPCPTTFWVDDDTGTWAPFLRAYCCILLLAALLYIIIEFCRFKLYGK